MVSGVHGYVPDFVMDNKEWAKYVDTNDEWIVSRTGIKERRFLKGEDQGSSVMGIEAVKGLLEKTNTAPEEVDLVLCCTVTPDMFFPATANIIANGVGAKNAFGFDLNAACSGFLYGLVTGSQFIETGKYKKVVVVGADKMSSIIDYNNRSTCVLFGDGAAAVMLEPTEEAVGVIDSELQADGVGEPYLHMKAGGSRRPSTHETIDANEHTIHQEGSTVFKFAVTKMADVSAEIVERNQLAPEEISYLVPHQANLRIIDATRRRVGLPVEKVMMNIDRYGNTTNATIPLCLWDYEKKLKKGDNLILAAFGGGFTWGSVYLKWGYDSK
ncbi:3-oxoacyl-[acyl-carrier-protein] synthase 3 protein 2 [Persicobacter psychrovividus]|uniref:Beta-ketoacyl-[acyl-carrier-protein] synthase III n=2 Tax=Persicobacter psychrovividus TaxID=387638 RepID=A0ABM7VCB6_9BACT|nr:3-oxoacyl-[acyl-carrier-protein] synthase 3 protein 2 [Persicobacter psychrovividus]